MAEQQDSRSESKERSSPLANACGEKGSHVQGDDGKAVRVVKVSDKRLQKLADDRYTELNRTRASERYWRLLAEELRGQVEVLKPTDNRVRHELARIRDAKALLKKDEQRWRSFKKGRTS